MCTCITLLLSLFPLPSCTQELLTQLRTVFDLIVELQHKQETIISQCLEEMERRSEYERRKSKRTEKVHGWITAESMSME